MNRGISLRILESAARNGNSEAQYSLGGRYRLGNGVEPDLVVARQWLMLAAEQGYADAQNDVGSMLLNGMGGPKDAQIAAILYERAAKQGHAEAQFNLALRYLHGDAVAEDPEIAASWLWLAMKQRHVEATCELGTLFRFGRGVNQSYKVAGCLHLQAAKGGDPVAHGNLCDYHRDIAALALSGDLQSALVMAEINSAGIGIDKDPVEGLAWALMVGTPDFPFQEDDDAEREQHRDLLSTLQSELSQEEQSASIRRCAVLRDQIINRKNESTPGEETTVVAKYDYFDKDGVVVRTPYSRDPLERGYDGFERYERNGWEDWPVSWSYVMSKACSITEDEANNLAASLDRHWSANTPAAAAIDPVLVDAGDASLDETATTLSPEDDAAERADFRAQLKDLGMSDDDIDLIS